MLYFTEFFSVSEEDLDAHGAFNISLLTDLPLFIDPFLLFGSEKSEYVALHEAILKYLSFLKTKAHSGPASPAEVKAWYKFPEVKQNWFGYSATGNSGTGLGPTFGKALSSNLKLVFKDLGHEQITESSHLEKACLFEIGVGRDHVSDFTCNLIKAFLLDYTERFALAHIDPSLRKEVKVDKVYFDYERERWMPMVFTLPYIGNDFVLLTPIDILTKDETWINSHELYGKFERICNSIPNDQLRHEVNNYLLQRLPARDDGKKHSAKDKAAAYSATLKSFPEILDYYIRSKEENKAGARSVSKERVDEVYSVFVKNVMEFFSKLSEMRATYTAPESGTMNAALERILFMKHVIEHNDGYRLFYVKGKPIKREQDLQIIYRLTWHGTRFDVNSEVNNGRGPVDYKVSDGAADKTLVEFKLASNSKLKKNLEKQVGVYEKANSTRQSIKVILYFSGGELATVKAILKELGLDDNPHVILIDARNDNKPSASNA